ncbi:hypothetical protein Micbo1qcDRAFT_170312 [Microdochium bolleyi]|uniref:Apple domain-containing protein n=1 Tax=Microdochium bolleyi TaxID=196109 RepID=A0A136JH54_9PEZI|nr:hypothetical protein Micbo1qcDRAFT_170312 [Microdochium bolleyi]
MTRLADCASFFALELSTVFRTITITPTARKPVTDINNVADPDATVTVTPVISRTTVVTTFVIFQDTTVTVTPVVTQSTTFTTINASHDTTETTTPLTTVVLTVTTVPVNEGFTETATPVTSQFFTVTPAPSTTVSVVTVSSISVTRPQGPPQRRSADAFPVEDKSLPAYATGVCSDPVAYSWACVCAGVTNAATAATTTVITTVTAEAVISQTSAMIESTPISPSATIKMTDSAMTTAIPVTATTTELRTATGTASEATSLVSVTAVSTVIRTVTVTTAAVTSQLPATAILTISTTTTVTAPMMTTQITTTIPADTVTRTATTTATGTKTGYACDSEVQGNGAYSSRRYRANCTQRVMGGQANSSSTTADQPGCLRACNNIADCLYAEYFFDTGMCNLYYTRPMDMIFDARVDALMLM